MYNGRTKTGPLVSHGFSNEYDRIRFLSYKTHKRDGVGREGSGGPN